jgi:hypothetical protein
VYGGLRAGIDALALGMPVPVKMRVSLDRLPRRVEGLVVSVGGVGQARACAWRFRGSTGSRCAGCPQTPASGFAGGKHNRVP